MGVASGLHLVYHLPMVSYLLLHVLCGYVLGRCGRVLWSPLMLCITSLLWFVGVVSMIMLAVNLAIFCYMYCGDV